MTRYRIQFSKKGPVKFISHLDLLRNFERAFRRAGLPLAFSQGFNPHPRLFFAAPLPVGMEGEREYLDLELEKNIEIENLFSLLSNVFPEGIQIKKIWYLQGNEKALMATLKKASYSIEADFQGPAHRENLNSEIQSFLSAGIIEVTVKKKECLRIRNIRPGIHNLKGGFEQNKLYLEMELQAGGSGNIRPEEVFGTFMEKSGLIRYITDFNIKRTNLFFSGWPAIE